tara:strand:- start:499 stop:915 length:417 start_codon:yes stop_codon:yes gene_type:complete
MYTNKEKEIIRDGYRNLGWLVSRITGCEWDLDQAVKSGKDRGCVLESRARVIGAFLDGYRRGKSISAQDLYGLCDWYSKAAIVGAGYAHREGPVKELRPYLKKLRKNSIAAMNAAVEAHGVARGREIDQIMGRTGGKS